MQRLNFTIEIDAPKEKVWQTLWNDETYRQWTSAFCEGSYFVGDLQEGGRIHFLAPDGQGMFSDVEKFVENEFVSFKHIGEMKDKAELPLNEETEKWSGNYENYSLTENNGMTTLAVEIDAVEEYLNFFNEKMPLAMENVKKLSETRASAVA
jgi:uncharacterized protein YndB with AHSA1/START domain